MEGTRTRSTARSEVVSLIGARCSGKTSAGRELARRLGWAFVDLDEEIARAHAAARGTTELRPAGSVLEGAGESAFRDLESRALAGILDRPGPFVLATGGGVVERDENRKLLARRTTCIWLRVATNEMQRRMRSDPAVRPPLEGGDPIEELPGIAERREPAYAETCELELDCRGLRVGEIARRIAERIGRGRPGTCG
jgi:shikimate kinase